jgi:hypothetical protein
LLVIRQIYHEIIPAISTEIFFGIKTYQVGDRRCDYVEAALRRASEFCRNAQRVIINLSSADGDWTSLRAVITKELMKFNKLAEITLRLMVFNKRPSSLNMVTPLLDVAKKNSSILCVELIDSRNFRDEPDSRTAGRLRRERFENAIYQGAERILGPESEVSLLYTQMAFRIGIDTVG